MSTRPLACFLVAVAACGGRVPTEPEPVEGGHAIDARTSIDAGAAVATTDASAETTIPFSDALGEIDLPPLDLDAADIVCQAYLPYWFKALEQGMGIPGDTSCTRCTFEMVTCDLPYSGCATGTACIYEHCQSPADAPSFCECVRSCFRIGSDCVTRWYAYMACTVSACADVCR